MADYIDLRVDDLPEVVQVPDGINAGGWSWDHRDGVPTWDDLRAVAAAVLWYEQHPEVVPDGE